MITLEELLSKNDVVVMKNHAIRKSFKIAKLKKKNKSYDV